MMFVNLTDTGLTNTMILNHLNPQSRSARTVSLPEALVSSIFSAWRSMKFVCTNLTKVLRLHHNQALKAKN